jgi:putative ABC transport system ATP-binding protein
LPALLRPYLAIRNVHSVAQQIVRLRGLARTYRRGAVAVPVLRGVDLEVDLGEWVAIMGPSGSGKSTLLNLVGLLDQPDAGIYELDGEDVSDVSEVEQAKLRNAKIGFVFQSFNLLPRTSALDNVGTPLMYARVRRADRAARARAALDAVGLGQRMYHDASELSGGEIQRVAVARALINEPSLVLADEPTGNLDAATGAEIIGLFEQLHAAGRTIVFITHEAELAGRADRQFVLRDGRLAAA